MHFKRVAFAADVIRLFVAISGCASFVVLNGCTAHQIEHQALSHNQAFTNSADKILLANIIRSSRYLPVDYTAITDYTGEGAVSGSVQGKFPFGADASRLFNLDPSISVSPGIASLEIKDFAQQKESFFKLYEDVEIQNFVNLIDSGWEVPLIMTFLFQSIRVRGKFAQELISRSDALCYKQKSEHSDSYACDLIRRSHDECPKNKSDDKEFIEKKGNITPVRLYRTYVNSGDDKCAFLAFQAILARSYLMGIGYDVVAASKITVIFDETDKSENSLKKLHDDVNEELSGSNRAAFETIGRSTHLMLRFLGQLARAQLHLPEGERWTPKIALDPRDSHKETPLFLIREGAPTDEKAAVTVELDGRSYYIPEATYRENDHKSLHLFTYLRIRLDQAYAQTKLPPSNTLVLR